MIDYGFGVFLDIINKEDLDHLRCWRNSPQIWRWCRQNDLIYPEQQEKWYHWQRDDQKTRMYSVKNSEMELIGVCGLTDIDLINRRAEFSLYVGLEFQGHGFSKPILKTLFSYGFKELGLRSIWGETFEDNRAQDVFRSIGMIEDGRRRQFYVKNGKHCDAILFSMLNTEFAELPWNRSLKAL